MKNPVIFVIDMLNDCFGHESLARKRADLCRSINRLTAFARSKNFPVVWVRQEYEADLSDAFLDMQKNNIKMFIKDTPGSQILDELVRKTSDIEIIKKRYSMFYETGLDELLAELNPSKLILAGVNTHACIRMAAIDACQRNFEVCVVRECVASKDGEHHEVTMQYFINGGIAEVLGLDELLESSGI